MNKSIPKKFNRSRVIKLEIPKGTEDQVKAAMDFRFLKYPEDLKDCVMLEGHDKGTLSIQYKFEGEFEPGESLGYFTDDLKRFITNEHWSERMRIANGNPTPFCCHVPMHAGGSGFTKKEGVAWECPRCGKQISIDN